MRGGQHDWRRVLFDTNMVSRWMDGDSDFQAPLKALVRKLAKRNATFFVSAVTIQELMLFARASGADRKAHAFLSNTFSTLEFDERAALEAARIGAAVPVARGAKQIARDLWHRDIAILGTASVHEVDAVITANGTDFLPFQDLVSCEIHIVAAVPLRGRQRGSGAKS